MFSRFRENFLRVRVCFLRPQIFGNTSGIVHPPPSNMLHSDQFDQANQAPAHKNFFNPSHLFPITNKL